MRTEKGRSRGRPPATDSLEEVLVKRSFSLPRRDMDALEEWAYRLRLNRVELLRRIVARGLEPFYRTIAEEEYSSTATPPTVPVP